MRSSDCVCFVSLIGVVASCGVLEWKRWKFGLSSRMSALHVLIEPMDNMSLGLGRKEKRQEEMEIYAMFKREQQAWS